jgi:hypothetical protein
VPSLHSAVAPPGAAGAGRCPCRRRAASLSRQDSLYVKFRPQTRLLGAKVDEQDLKAKEVERQRRAVEERRRKRNTIIGWTCAAIIVGGGYLGLKLHRDASSYAVKYEISGNGLMYQVTYTSQSGDKTFQQAGTTVDVSTRVNKSKPAIMTFAGFSGSHLECRIYKDDAVVAEQSYDPGPSSGWSQVFECMYDPK